MVKWIIKVSGKEYAEIVYDKKLRVYKLTPQAEADGLYRVFGQLLFSYDPSKRKLMQLSVDNIENMFDADLYVNSFFKSDDFTVECDKNFNWDKYFVNKPGVLQ